MTVKLSYAILTGGLLLGLSGCGSSGGGLSGGSTTPRSPTPVVNPTKTAPTNVLQSTTNTQNTNANTNTTNAGMTSATAFVANANDSKALNITRVVRPTGELAKEVQEVVRLTNELRAEKGLKPLQYDESLGAYAQMRASEAEITYEWFFNSPIRDKSLGHLRASGEKLDGVGENIDPRRPTARQAVTSWKNSPGHYANMINKNYDKIGVGVVRIPNSRREYYWVQIFGFNSTNLPYEFVDAGKDNATPLKQVVVDGRAIPLDLFSKGQWQPIGGQHQGQFTGYDQTRFGAVTVNNQTQLFYQGNQTLDYAIPKSGTANYQGTALVIKDGKTDTNIDSRFTANFGTRKLNGTLSQKNTTLYTISADINGSGFASKKDAPVQTQGAFFGQNAQELAGVFKDTKTNARGVYGLYLIHI